MLVREVSRWKHTRLFERSKGHRPDTAWPAAGARAAPIAPALPGWPAGSRVRFTWACLAAVLESMKLCARGWGGVGGVGVGAGRWVGGKLVVRSVRWKRGWRSSPSPPPSLSWF